MFFDLSREKLLMMAVIVPAIAFFLAAFSFANAAWGILPQTTFALQRQESAAWYWLFYKLPGDPSLTVTSTPDGYAKSVPVLLYHGESGGADMPTAIFIDQMRALKAAGWQTITMQQFDEWERGQIQLPAKSFLLTFDDGRTDTFYPVDPVLQDLHYHAVMFVITGFSLPADGKTVGFYLNKTELQNMVKSGRWDLESHGDLDHALYAVQSTTDLTKTASTISGHYMSNKFWDSSTNSFETGTQFEARVTDDLARAKEKLQSDVGVNAIAYAYPFNDFGEDSVNFPGSQSILDQVVPRKYTYAFYQTWPANGDAFNYPLINNGPGSSPYMIKRIEPQNDWSGQELVGYLDAASAKSLPYQSSSFGNAWKGTWGSATESANGLALSAAPNTTGAATFLDGSGWWKDYYAEAVVDWQAGSSVSLIARDSTQDDVTCAFSSSNITIERHVGQVQTRVISADHLFSGSRASARLGIAVSGHSITCYEDGIPIVSGYSPSMASQGSFGIEIWDQRAGVSKIVVRSVSVTTQLPRPTASQTILRPSESDVQVQFPEPTSTLPMIAIPPYSIPTQAATAAAAATQPPTPDTSVTATSSTRLSAGNTRSRSRGFMSTLFWREHRGD